MGNDVFMTCTLNYFFLDFDFSNVIEHHWNFVSSFEDNVIFLSFTTIINHILVDECIPHLSMLNKLHLKKIVLLYDFDLIFKEFDTFKIIKGDGGLFKKQTNDFSL